MKRCGTLAAGHTLWAKTAMAAGTLVALTLTGCSEEPIRSDAGPRDAQSAESGTDIGTELDVEPRMDGSGFGACGGVTCRVGQLCRYNQCVPDLGRCTVAMRADGGMVGTDAAADGGVRASECPSDSYCDEQGFCTPYGVPADRTRDDTCRTRSIPAPLVPATQCAWTMHNLNGTPVVMDLGIGPRQEFEVKPSIVASVNDIAGSTYTGAGHLYIFDGRTCEQQFALTAAGLEIVSSATPALGDLDLDGKPEIIVAAAAGGIIAFRYDPAMMQFVVSWRAMAPNFTAGTISLADVTGDAHPEVIYGGAMYSHTGMMLAPPPAILAPTGYARAVVIADVDLDGEQEMVVQNLVYRFDVMMGRWVKEDYDMSVNDTGDDAVADFGDFPMGRENAPGRPEVVHWDGTALTIRTIGGTNVFRAPAPALDFGGPPAIADIDGDGLPEIVVAGHALIAFDPDCTRTPRAGGQCESRTTNGLLWTQNGLHDLSGARNGVTVFDFDGDGRSEVVEADECFVRIFDGRTGTARWSAARWSATYIEMPIVADVDNDYSAEIVVGSNDVAPTACGLAAGAADPILPGFACINDGACPMGSSCRGGLCRCTMAAQCGANNTCTAPLRADGMGNVCRSTFNRTIGLKVYGDARNRWVPSRPVWNQYSYSITNIGDMGTVPPRAMQRNNWQVPGLNDYRRNTQGALGDQGAPNLTIGPSPGGCVGGAMGPARLSARFCNRGTGVAGAQSSIQFDAVSPGGMRTPLCTASADRAIAPGTCVDVMCMSMMPLARDATVEAVADANDQVQECHEDDNRRVIYRPEDCIL